MKRNMENTASKAKNTIPDNYNITTGEILTLMKKARSADANEALYAIADAFRYGFVLGHRATLAGKVKKRL